MQRITLDTPWKRPGRAAYARRRRAALLHPPVTVYEMPDDVLKQHDVPVRMRDGVTLRLNLFRPAGVDGPLPVLLSAHPYGKDVVPTKKRGRWSLNPQFRIMNQPEPLRISDQTSWEAPDPVWWAHRGYAVINLDTRGGGRSEGRGDLFSDQEADDIAQVIAWAAEQPWSNGRVGMLGVSYLAISQYKVAALNPPALKAICPWEGFTDAYRDFFTSGGVVENGFAQVWLFLSGRAARLTTDLAKERRQHPLRDAWWDAITPDLSKITVPILECTSFSDDNLHSGGSMRAFQQVASVHRHAYIHRAPKWAAFLRRGGAAPSVGVLRSSPSRSGCSGAPARSSRDPRPRRSHRRSAGGAGVAPGAHRLAPAPSRRRRCPQRDDNGGGCGHLGPETQRRCLRAPLRRGHRDQWPDGSAHTGQHLRSE
jgi:hypothetical protein